MTKSSRTHLIIGALLLGATAQASVKLGTDSELFVTGTAALQYNDNLFLSNANAKSDSILDFSPGFQVLFGQNSQLKGTFDYYEDFQIYTSNSNLNADLANVDFSTTYDDGKSKVNSSGSFKQADQATVDVRGAGFLVHRNVTDLGLNGENELTQKTSLGLGVAYEDNSYSHTGYTNWRYVDVPVNYYFKVLPKLDLSGGFKYRDNELGTGGINSKEYFYNVGARGELAPKLSGEVHVGLHESDPAKGTSHSELGIDSNYTYAATPKTSLTFGINNDFGYSAVGTSYRNFGLNGGVQAAVSSEFKITGSLGYTRYSYTTTAQRDDFYTGQIGGSYLVNAYLTLNGGYSYSEDSSNLAGSSFKGNQFKFSAAFRY